MMWQKHLFVATGDTCRVRDQTANQRACWGWLVRPKKRPERWASEWVGWTGGRGIMNPENRCPPSFTFCPLRKRSILSVGFFFFNCSTELRKLNIHGTRESVLFSTHPIPPLSFMVPHPTINPSCLPSQGSDGW